MEAGDSDGPTRARRPRTSRRRSAPRAIVAAGVVLCTVIVAACVPPPPDPATGPSPNDAPRADEPAYAQRGPYEVGVSTVSLGDRSAEVWYPADADGIGSQASDEYFIREYVSGFFDELLPPEVNPPYVTDAYREVPAASGRFPLVLFSHGFASYRTQSTFLTTHLASWGFVVISPDYLERGLRAVLGEPPPRSRNDLDVAGEAIARAGELDVTEGGLLEDRIDTSTVYPVGHSAGGGTSLRLLSRPDVTMAIPLAAGYSLLDLLRTGLPVGKPITWIAAPRDRIVAIADVRRGFAYTSGERRIVEIGSSGHVNAFSDICEIGDGGVAAIARATGLPIPEALLLLGDDGCPVPRYKDSPEVWPEVRHFVTAELRFRSGLDPEPVGLGSGVVDAFDDVVRYRHAP